MTDDLKPASITQVRNIGREELVRVEDDVLSVVRQLKEIDDGLKVWADPVQGLFIVYHEEYEPGTRNVVSENLVLTCHALDGRVVQRVRQIDADGYSYSEELEELDEAAERRRVHEHRERIGEGAEKLAWAIGKDLGFNNRAFVPRGVRDDG